jgi:hypothetical protein
VAWHESIFVGARADEGAAPPKQTEIARQSRANEISALRRRTAAPVLRDLCNIRRNAPCTLCSLQSRRRKRRRSRCKVDRRHRKTPSQLTKLSNAPECPSIPTSQNIAHLRGDFRPFRLTLHGFSIACDQITVTRRMLREHLSHQGERTPP